eukprot:1750-Heterococcus_DN1.PRE.1
MKAVAEAAEAELCNTQTAVAMKRRKLYALVRSRRRRDSSTEHGMQQQQQRQQRETSSVTTSTTAKTQLRDRPTATLTT